MSAADPRCLVCGGTGRVSTGWPSQPETPCACTEVQRRDISATSSNGWLAEALGPMLERAAVRHAELERHRETCTDRPCAKCERFVCKCGAPVDARRRCEACEWSTAFDAFETTLPKRFRWALSADEALLGARVQTPSDVLRRGLTAPPNGGLIVIGPSGSGKTSLTLAMLGAWVRKAPAERAGALFVEAFTLAGARARWPLGQGEAPDVRAAIQAPLLVLDDLGSEKDDRNGVLSDVMLARHNAERPTWTTTWLEPEQCGERYSGAIARRLFETGKVLRLGHRSATPAREGRVEFPHVRLVPGAQR